MRTASGQSSTNGAPNVATRASTSPRRSCEAQMKDKPSSTSAQIAGTGISKMHELLFIFILFYIKMYNVYLVLSMQSYFSWFKSWIWYVLFLHQMSAIIVFLWASYFGKNISIFFFSSSFSSLISIFHVTRQYTIFFSGLVPSSTHLPLFLYFFKKIRKRSSNEKIHGWFSKIRSR